MLHCICIIMYIMLYIIVICFVILYKWIIALYKCILCLCVFMVPVGDGFAVLPISCCVCMVTCCVPPHPCVWGRGPFGDGHWLQPIGHHRETAVQHHVSNQWHTEMGPVGGVAGYSGRSHWVQWAELPIPSNLIKLIIFISYQKWSFELVINMKCVSFKCSTVTHELPVYLQLKTFDWKSFFSLEILIVNVYHQ